MRTQILKALIKKNVNWLLVLAVVGLGGYFLWTRQGEGLSGWLPLGILLLCPLMHLFMHGQHGGHGNSERDDKPQDRGR